MVIREPDGTIRIEPDTVERTVPGLGRVVLRGPTMSVERRLSLAYERPVHLSYRRFVNDLIAGCATTPLSVEEVDALPEFSRARLRNAMAEVAGADRWLRRLRGSHLSGDERLFAAMLWEHREQRRRVRALLTGERQRLAERLRVVVDATGLVARMEARRKHNLLAAAGLTTSITRLFGQHRSMTHLLREQESIAQTVSKLVGPSTRASLASISSQIESLVPRHGRVSFELPTKRLVDAARLFVQTPEQAKAEAEVSAFLRRWEHSAYWFLLQGLGMRSASRLARADASELEEALLDGLERMVREGTVTRAVSAAVGRTALLAEPQREVLAHGLELAQQGTWAPACALLSDGLEGALWAAARAEEIIDAERRWLAGSGKQVSSVDALFTHLPLPRPLTTFLRRKVFGSTGNPYRHGDAASGHRRQALYQVAALIGWLEEFTDEGIGPPLGSGLGAQLARAA